MLARGNDAPFRAVVGLLRAYLNDLGNRLTVDAQLVHAGHTGRPGQGFEVVPGIALRFALASIYAALVQHKDAAQVRALDIRLGLVDPDEVPEVEVAEDPRLRDDVPTAANDPAALAALAAFGDS